MNIRLSALEIRKRIRDLEGTDAVPSEDDIKRIARLLAKQKLVEHGQSRKTNKRKIFKIGLTSQSLKKTLRDPISRQNIYQLLETGESFTVQAD